MRNNELTVIGVVRAADGQGKDQYFSCRVSRDGQVILPAGKTVSHVVVSYKTWKPIGYNEAVTMLGRFHPGDEGESLVFEGMDARAYEENGVVETDYKHFKKAYHLTLWRGNVLRIQKFEVTNQDGKYYLTDSIIFADKVDFEKKGRDIEVMSEMPNSFKSTTAELFKELMTEIKKDL